MPIERSDIDTLKAAATRLRVLAGATDRGGFPRWFVADAIGLEGLRPADAEFIATMDPDLALLLSDWLAHEVERTEDGSYDSARVSPYALAVARKVVP